MQVRRQGQGEGGWVVNACPDALYAASALHLMNHHFRMHDENTEMGILLFRQLKIPCAPNLPPDRCEEPIDEKKRMQVKVADGVARRSTCALPGMAEGLCRWDQTSPAERLAISQ